jgi:hypothetical protein
MMGIRDRAGSIGGESSRSTDTSSISSNSSTFVGEKSSRQLHELLRLTSSFYGSQFAFRTKLPPAKQLLDNLIFKHPDLNNDDIRFVIEITQSIEKEARLLDLLLE